MPGEDDISLGELSRKLDDLRSDFRELRQGYIPRGEYEEHRKATGERIGGIEKDVAKVEATISQINRTAWTGVILPILVTIIGAIILAAVGLK